MRLYEFGCIGGCFPSGGKTSSPSIVLSSTAPKWPNLEAFIKRSLTEVWTMYRHRFDVRVGQRISVRLGVKL